MSNHKDIDEMYDRMQTPEAERAMQAAFDATPEQLGQAAVNLWFDKINERRIALLIENYLGTITDEEKAELAALTKLVDDHFKPEHDNAMLKLAEITEELTAIERERKRLVGIRARVSRFLRYTFSRFLR